MRVAIVHPWFITNGGGERVIDALAGIFPSADLFALIVDKRSLSSAMQGRKIQSSFLSRIPMAGRYYQHLMPLYPLATSSLDVTGYDLVISSGGPATKGVVVSQNAKHVHYCHSPVRFLWDQYPVWHRRLPKVAQPGFAMAAHQLREWDFNSAQRVDHFIANSAFIAKRIQTYYRRTSTVIHPPVDTSRGYLAANRGDYYLCVARLVPGKRIDLLVETCSRLAKRLIIVGEGPEKHRLESLAADCVKFVGRVSESQLSDLYARARAFLFSAEEDFGIAPVEAQAYGLPVIAYGKGGVLETVLSCDRYPDNPTGVLYFVQTFESLRHARSRFESMEYSFDHKYIQAHAQAFDTTVFSREIHTLVDSLFERGDATASSTVRSQACVEVAPI
jgi:glycosyltransferase involved in cell wall biosynthesis